MEVPTTDVTLLEVQQTVQEEEDSVEDDRSNQDLREASTSSSDDTDDNDEDKFNGKSTLDDEFETDRANLQKCMARIFMRRLIERTCQEVYGEVDAVFVDRLMRMNKDPASKANYSPSTKRYKKFCVRVRKRKATEEMVLRSRQRAQMRKQNAIMQDGKDLPSKQIRKQNAVLQDGKNVQSKQMRKKHAVVQDGKDLQLKQKKSIKGRSGRALEANSVKGVHNTQKGKGQQRRKSDKQTKGDASTPARPKSDEFTVLLDDLDRWISPIRNFDVHKYDTRMEVEWEDICIDEFRHSTPKNSTFGGDDSGIAVDEEDCKEISLESHCIDLEVSAQDGERIMGQHRIWYPTAKTTIHYDPGNLTLAENPEPEIISAVTEPEISFAQAQTETSGSSNNHHSLTEDNCGVAEQLPNETTAGSMAFEGDPCLDTSETGHISSLHPSSVQVLHASGSPRLPSTPGMLHRHSSDNILFKSARYISERSLVSQTDSPALSILDHVANTSISSRMQRSKPVQMSGPVLKTLFLSQRITESVDTVEQTTREPLEGTSHQAGTVINVRVAPFIQNQDACIETEELVQKTLDSLDRIASSLVKMVLNKKYREVLEEQRRLCGPRPGSSNPARDGEIQKRIDKEDQPSGSSKMSASTRAGEEKRSIQFAKGRKSETVELVPPRDVSEPEIEAVPSDTFIHEHTIPIGNDKSLAAGLVVHKEKAQSHIHVLSEDPQASRNIIDPSGDPSTRQPQYAPAAACPPGQRPNGTFYSATPQDLRQSVLEQLSSIREELDALRRDIASAQAQRPCI